MCLLFFSYQTTPGYRLVVAANRDEFLSRPTAPLGFFDAEQKILAGRDLQGGGTWLGITAQLRFAALTNYRNPQENRTDAPSRGEILTDFLSGNMDAGRFMQRLAEKSLKYNGFNLILGDEQALYYHTNTLAGVQKLDPGFYGLSNSLLDVPWPKVVRGKKILYPHMVATNHIDTGTLFKLLSDDHRPPDDQLPDTGVGLDWERLLSSICIDGEDYGTRSSAVITVTDAGEITFAEMTRRPSSGKSAAAKFQQYCLKSR